MTAGTLTTQPRQPLVLADVLGGGLVRDAGLVAGGAAFVGLLAQISIHLPFTPVPITGQTLAVLLTSVTLGWRRGTAALMLYALAGLAGIPWFAAGASGYLGANFGYILGFILCAMVCGKLAERRADRSLLTAAPAMLLGEIVMYTVGVPWLAVDLHVGLGKAISLGLTPFILADLCKAAIAALALPGLWRLLERRDV
jgi:biotin transport system substrate-specific component